MTPVIDIFAGPGGLSEGFASVRDKQGGKPFRIALSVEMDEDAHQTLQLRSFFRQFGTHVPDAYYEHLRGQLERHELFKQFPEEARLAKAECWRAKLGGDGVSPERVRRRIDAALDGHDEWVLIGGPPCQAYSVAGRSRNGAEPDYDPTKDVRQRLYVEYLQVLAEHQPSVFVMENVKGLLSATLRSENIFVRILEDLRQPAAALRRQRRHNRRVGDANYRIYSLVERREFDNGCLDGAVIKAELYGVPQARHRVILLGVREDIEEKPGILKRQGAVSAARVLTLMRLRSGLSEVSDGAEKWKKLLQSQVNRRWANAGATKAGGATVSTRIKTVLGGLAAPVADRGGDFVAGTVVSRYRPRWYCDPAVGGACNHHSRTHMLADLNRYLYAACYAKAHRRSPALNHFPTDLLPDHDNVDVALTEGGNFSDRFRVQVGTRPATTIVSHISKDGHYYIHPDPTQCRSLTVREAARLQTFPDNYYFCGPRTRQYIQVGNAVPPLLARQIGELVADVIKGSSATD